MAGIENFMRKPNVCVIFLALLLGGCVSTEELYAKYDAADCNLVAVKDSTGNVQLHEQNTDTRFPWEPAVYFDYDSSELLPAEQARIRKSMQVLKQYPTLHLGLQGFTDKRGDDVYNRLLAQRRVAEVKDFLVANGIDPSRIMLQPIGKVLPQISDDDATARAVNRRVELMLLEKDGKPMLLELALVN